MDGLEGDSRSRRGIADISENIDHFPTNGELRILKSRHILISGPAPTHRQQNYNDAKNFVLNRVINNIHSSNLKPHD